MDFEELREYIPGDDVRSIDWNVTARMRRPFVKNYREERELNAIVALDISGSSDFGTCRTMKRAYAARVAATLLFSALRSGDKASLLLFTSEVELFLPPRKGKRHFLRAVRELIACEPRKRGTDLRAALRFLDHTARPRSIIFLITDFLHTVDAREEGDIFQQIGGTNARHDLVCVHLTDPRERLLPAAGLLALEDAETGEVVEVNSDSPAFREAYAAEAAEREAALERALVRQNVDLLRLENGADYPALLTRFFESRKRLRSR
jgi:uncharacterized protein (DUF58 family)